MISVMRSRSACLAITPIWNKLVDQQSHLPLGIGPICQLQLTLLAKEILAPQSNLNIITLKDDNGQIAILPCFLERQGQQFLSWEKLGCVPNLYPGRVGIIHDDSAPHIADSLALAILSDLNTWHAFSITVVANSTTESAILKAANSRAFAHRMVSETEIPFIVFPPTWEKYIASLAKKFRYTIRSGERQLRKLGNLEVRSYEEPGQCDEFLKLAYMIERKSWKEGTGTSLTKQPIQKHFHDQLAAIAAGLGMFRGYILLLDGEPIAHIYGLQSGDVLCDLKESFDERYADSSPGSVLKALVMQELIGGTVKAWDFIGRTEFHKLRWTNEAYRQRHYVIYAGGKGRLLRWRHDLGMIMRKFHILPAQKDQFGRPGSSGQVNSS